MYGRSPKQGDSPDARTRWQLLLRILDLQLRKRMKLCLSRNRAPLSAIPALEFKYLTKCAAVLGARHRNRLHSFPKVACAICTYDDAAAMHRHSCLQLCRCYSRTMSSLLKAQGSETRSIFSGRLPDQLAKKGLPYVLKCPVRCHGLNWTHRVLHCTRLSKASATNVASVSGQDAVAYSKASASNGATTGDKAPHVPVLLQEASLCCNLRNL